MSSKKKILVLGAGGMLGSGVTHILSQNLNLDVIGTVRKLPYKFKSRAGIKILKDATDIVALKEFVANSEPDIIINCIGLIKQKNIELNNIVSTKINTELPKNLEKLTSPKDFFIIHFSTDCVFSGLKGRYSECDEADADDIYGRSKFLGELKAQNTLTIRCSIIGHELYTQNSLLDWFLCQTGSVFGYKNAFFSGITTIEMGKFINLIIMKNLPISGLYHLSSSRISKFNLLKKIAHIYNKNINIIPIDEPRIDRSLVSEKLKIKMNYVPPSWHYMLKELKQFWEDHDKFKK